VVTISNYLEEFIKTNVVYEKEFDVSEGGRRPLLLDINSQAAYAIGVGLNLTNMVGLLTDLKGNIITKTQIDRPRATVKEITECLLDIIRQVLKRSKEYLDNIQGIGVGIAGLVNRKDGSIHWPEKIDNNYTYASVNIPLKDFIEREFNLPVLIENDATAACFGEQWLGLNQGAESIIYMFSGVGIGFILNGQLYTGTEGFAGEAAIHNYKESKLFNCALGNPCFLKRWETDLGMVQELKDRVSSKKPGAEQILGMVDNKIENIDLKIIFMANRQKNPLVAEVLAIAAKRLGIKIAYLVNLLNPQIVVVGGGLEESGEDFLDRVRQTVNDWAFREMTRDLKIIYSQLRENSVAQGAASLVMRQIFANL
jgi:predicted NBD/HSP70 family sugar kinase